MEKGRYCCTREAASAIYFLLGFEEMGLIQPYLNVHPLW